MNEETDVKQLKKITALIQENCNIEQRVRDIRKRFEELKKDLEVIERRQLKVLAALCDESNRVPTYIMTQDDRALLRTYCRQLPEMGQHVQEIYRRETQTTGALSETARNLASLTRRLDEAEEMADYLGL